MSYIIKINNKAEVSALFKNDYKNASLENKDALLMDLFGELGFNCGKTRWDSPILYTHMNSRKIVVAIQCPTHCSGWDGCPHIIPNPGQTFAFIHQQEYDIRIMSAVNGFIGKTIIYESRFNDWLALPKNIRTTWGCSL